MKAVLEGDACSLAGATIAFPFGATGCLSCRRGRDSAASRGAFVLDKPQRTGTYGFEL